MPRMLFVLFALSLCAAALFACTETPSYLPPCVDPNAPCPPFDAGGDSDASDAAADAAHAGG